jgi:AcrR family transcriptional regulator
MVRKSRKGKPAPDLVEPQAETESAETNSKEKDTRRLIVDVAEHLYRQIGFQKTTVVDIARELHMSSANIYRFVASKSDIDQAVCTDLLGKIEAKAEKIAVSPGAADQRIRNLFGSIEKTYYKQYCAPTPAQTR